MTKLDALIRQRNIFISAAIILAAVSFLSALSMRWWINPYDYWLMWASIATGIGSVVSSVGGAALHLEWIDSQRNN